LRDVLRQVRVPNHAESRRIHKINVTLHELCKRGLGSPLSILAQKLLVRHVVQSQDSNRPTENRTGTKGACPEGANFDWARAPPWIHAVSKTGQKFSERFAVEHDR